MKTAYPIRQKRQSGNALVLTMVIIGVSVATLAGVMAWAATTYKVSDRYSQYTRAVAAAEANTEKVLTQISADYQSGGDSLVSANLGSYRQLTLHTSDSSYWSDWEFNDAMGHTGQTYVQPGGASTYVVLNSTYAGLKGFVTTYTLVSNARQPNSSQTVVGGVLQQIQLARIPIFQFAMYTSGDMEIGNGQPFTINGRVHSNQQLYVEPISNLVFQADVEAVGSILYARSPLDGRTPPYGLVTYDGQKISPAQSLSLPIGTTNTPTAVREIIEPPAAGENASSPIGRQRYFNLADMLITVSDTGVTASSGDFNGFATSIPTNQVASFVSTNASFNDAREGKTVESVDVNIGALKSWSATNSNLRSALGSRDVSSVYVYDRRNRPGTVLKAVRAVNGAQLPPLGLTLATGDPLYVLGNFNTTSPLPASLVGDAITILSPSWSDTNSTAALASRNASPTGVNAAILAGAVETTLNAYGGGMENFPRFLETWGAANAFTYNGSMVKMFPSLYATNQWGKANVYGPPQRVWAYDTNFDDPTKLPPLTPGLVKVIRSQWAAVGPNQTNAPSSF